MRRPYEGTAVSSEAMQAHLDWESGLVAQLHRDGSYRFRVLAAADGEAFGPPASQSWPETS